VAAVQELHTCSFRPPAGDPPVVVLGLLWAGLSLARSLGRARVDVSGVAIHDHEFGMRSRYLSRRTIVREENERRRDERVLAAIAEAAAGGRVVLVPERDEHVELLLRNWDDVQALAELPLPSDPELVHRLRRKDLLPREAERVGIPMPRTVTPASEEEVRALDLHPPFLVKPLEGQHFASAFRRKLLVADTVEEALAAWRSARERGFATVIQEHIPDSHGKIYSLFAYVGREGAPLATVVGRKVRQGPVRFGTSAVFEVLDEPRVREAGLRLLETAGYRGFGHVEFAHDARDDTFKLLEVNTRMPMWAGIAMTRWFDIARIAYDDMRGVPPSRPQTLTDEVVWIFLGKDVWVSADMARRRELGPVDFLAPYLRSRKARAVFAADDPLPSVACIGYLSSKVV
jgi:D-aspartate ligase